MCSNPREDLVAEPAGYCDENGCPSDDFEFDWAQSDGPESFDVDSSYFNALHRTANAFRSRGDLYVAEILFGLAADQL